MKKLKWLFRILIITLIAFIWIHSMMPKSASSTESQAVTGFLSTFFPGLSNNIVRKAAHLCEYAALGALFAIYTFVLEKKCAFIHFINLLFSGLTVAILDETIQIFSGRGPMIRDIWIDLVGVAVSAYIIKLITQMLRGKHC